MSSWITLVRSTCLIKEHKGKLSQTQARWFFCLWLQPPPCPSSTLLGFADYFWVVDGGTQAQGCLILYPGGYPNHTCLCMRVQPSVMLASERADVQPTQIDWQVTYHREKLHCSIKLQLRDSQLCWVCLLGCFSPTSPFIEFNSNTGC